VNATLLLVFARCAGFCFRAPGLAHPSVPHPVRAAFAVLLTLGVYPGVRHTRADGLVLLAELAAEFVLGTAIGIGASLLYDAAYAGGRMLDDYVGVKAISPSVALVAPSGFGRVWSLAFTGGYFLLGAYRLTIYGFAQSFTRIAPGASYDGHAWAAFAASLAGTMVLVAVSVAAPAIALAFVTHVALAALSRAIPRFASFTLSFPLVFAAVLLVSALSIPILAARSAHPILLAPGPR
jgi:flagellar biosynthetic protein FliR